MTKLSVEQVLEIRRSPERSPALAARFGVTSTAIQHVRRGRTHGKIPWEEGTRPQRNTALKVHDRYWCLARLAVGDAAFFPGVARTSASGRAQYWGQKTGFRFQLRTVQNGIRIRRIA